HRRKKKEQQLAELEQIVLEQVPRADCTVSFEGHDDENPENPRGDDHRLGLAQLRELFGDHARVSDHEDDERRQCHCGPREIRLRGRCHRDGGYERRTRRKRECTSKFQATSPVWHRDPERRPKRRRSLAAAGLVRERARAPERNNETAVKRSCGAGGRDDDLTRSGARAWSGTAPAGKGRAMKGSHPVNVLPLPASGLEASILPPCISASRRARESPTPRPVCFRSMAWSACANISKAFGSTSRGLPMPSSVTSSRTLLPSIISERALCPPSSAA